MNEPHERPKIAHEPISVLLPAFNQAAGLEPIVNAWLRELDRLDRPYELIIINDASTDGSSAVLDRLSAAKSSVCVLQHEERRGFGAALRTGLAAARHPLLFYTSCDYPYPPADLKKLLGVIDSADIAAGVRTGPVPAWMRHVGRVYRLLVRVVLGINREPLVGWRGWADWRRAVWLRLMFGLKLADVSSAFKLFRRSVFDRLPIQSDGQFVHAEIMAKATFLGCLIGEVPISRLGGNFRGVAEPDPPGVSFAAEARRVFRNPSFTRPAVESAPPAVEPQKA
jgi:glycosyltransferase involved in cell wall biosynthesis